MIVGQSKRRPIVPLGYHGVTNREQSEKLADVRSVGVTQLGPQVIEDVGRRRGRGRHGDAVPDGRVHGAADGALLELHHVLRQRASLVREDVLHLAELLVQIGRPGTRRRVRFRIVHLEVVVDEGRLICMTIVDYFLVRALPRAATKPAPSRLGGN